MSQSKEELIKERQANLPLPDDPPVASDWNSMDESTVNVKSGERQDDISYGNAADAGMREPATGDSAVRTDSEAFKTNTAGDDVGRQAKDGLGGIPNDAVTRDAKDKAGLADTTGKDYGYPQKNDPSEGVSK
ncbi:hypothetical protein LTS18_007313 [Coniosporium uncinatum]|uniref:Uncharacterized protein n=1 Tax=Coniosporium uncinatum TaxID=93489 RepID=A0ACC3D2N4_9PEZI|nr:hypothetical protein LTS18_007313 [Coniosporium uncinatum]